MRHGNKIIWEKWIDPLSFDSVEETEDNNEDHYDDEYMPKFNMKNITESKVKIILTPFGAIPYNENTASGKIFNFWNGHTNFAITNRISQIIENTDGVESLDVFTKYRFRISIGKAFNDSDVMRDINKNVYNKLEIKNVE